MPSLKELLAQKAALEQQISNAHREERASAIAQVKALMSEHGLTLADLGARATPAPKRGNSGKVPAKFRDPATGNAWSGRGLQPKWLKAAVASGRKLEDFAV
jgi:DNA-binding protein H-NS